MRTIKLSLLAFWMAGLAMADDSQWLSDVPQAINQAYAENKSVLLDFTGSDWCVWCKKLDAETFSKPEFIEYAQKHLVLVRVDFPNKKTQSDELKKTNKALKAEYDVRGYPSLLDLAPDGTILWRQTGYLAGGPAALIAKLEAVNPFPGTPEPVNVPVLKYPPATTRKPDEEPRLQGIIWSSSHPTVLLAGRSCEEGDSVEGMHILKIARDKVTVEWNGKTNELTMK